MDLEILWMLGVVLWMVAYFVAIAIGVNLKTQREGKK